MAVRRAGVRPAAWYLALGRARALERARVRVRRGMLAPAQIPSYINAASLRARLSTRDYLSRTVKDLRRFFKGFEARDGYNLSNIETWHKKRADTVRQYGEYLHLLQSSPYVAVSPKRYRGKRRSAFRAKLRRATGQGSGRQKRYVYHVESAERGADVSLSPSGQLQVREQIGGVQALRRYWYFRDYTRNHQQPVTFKSLISSAQRMLKDMPNHLWYALFSSSNGVIDVPVMRQFILQTLHRYEAEYGNSIHEGMPEELLGFVFAGTREQAMAEYIGRMERRAREQFLKEDRIKERRRRLSFQRRLGRVR